MKRPSQKLTAIIHGVTAALCLSFYAAGAEALNLPQVDPNSDTDNTINNFILKEVRQGRTNTIAGGGWWGPVDKFNVNQLWGITPSQSGTFEMNTKVTGKVACLMPGGGDGYGTSQSTLVMHNVMFNSERHKYVDRQLRNGEFIELTSAGWRDIQPGKTDPFRTQCFSREGVANIFGNNIPVQGDILRTGVKIPWWYKQSKPVLDNTPRGFNVMGTLVRSGTLRSVPIAAQAWYQKTGYHYSVLDHMTDSNGRLVPAVDVAGSTLKGNVRFHWYAMRGGREETHGNNDFEVEIHHMELRVEDGGEDHTYYKELASQTASPLSNQNYKELYTVLDTTRLPDGWHIISFHSHSIDKKTPGAAQFMQLAAELKVPVCIENHNPNACENDNGGNNGGDDGGNDGGAPLHAELINGNFDRDLEGWTLTDYTDRNRVGISNNAGDKLLLLRADTNRLGKVFQDVRVTPGEVIRFRAKVGGQLMNNAQASARLRFLDAAGNDLMDTVKLGEFTGYQSLTAFYSGDITVPQRAVKAMVSFFVSKGSGNAYVDGVGFRRMSADRAQEPDGGTVPQQPAEPVQPVSLLQDGDFSNGKGAWEFYSSAAGNHLNVQGGMAQLWLFSRGDNIQLYHRNLPLTAGKNYVLTFKAASMMGVPLKVEMRQHNAPNRLLGLDTTVGANGAMQSYRIPFTATESESDARLRFDFSNLPGTVVILDDITLEEVQ